MTTTTRALLPSTISFLLALAVAACADDEATPADGAVDAVTAPDAPADSAAGDDASPPDTQASLACNGAAALCDRRYDEITFATTHNGMSASAEGWTHPDQRYGIARQLADGIRALMLDVHTFEGAPTLCHGSACATGHRPL